jgi:hypothetical protein
MLMLGVNRYYRDVNKEIEVDPVTTFGAKGDHAIVLVGRMQKPVLKALDYAIAARHDSLEAVHLHRRGSNLPNLNRTGQPKYRGIPLCVIESFYREVASSLSCAYITKHREEFGSEVVTVYTWSTLSALVENLLHNHKARRLCNRLMLMHGVTIALVPWLLTSTELMATFPAGTGPGTSR